MQYLFGAWPSIARRLKKSKHILLSADFDGTLTPIKPKPQQVKFRPDTRLLLRKIANTDSFFVAIISGRALKDLQRKVGLKGLIYSGNHGLEIAYKNRNFVYPGASGYLSLISRIAQKLKEGIASFPQAVVEEKGLSLSLHYRLVKKARLPRLREIFLQTSQPYLAARRIKLTSGKKVWDIRPPIEWDKGKAILWLRQRLKAQKLLTIYIGDDLTDEDAFRAVNKIGGISIVVGRKRNSSAKYYLKSVKDAQKFLSEISQLKQDAKNKKS